MEITALVNWNIFVKALMKVFFLIVKLRTAPASYHPLQSPHNRIAVHDVWSKMLFSQMVRNGELNNAPRALLFLTTLCLNMTSGDQLRFSMPKASSFVSSSGSASSNVIMNSFAPLELFALKDMDEPCCPLPVAG